MFDEQDIMARFGRQEMELLQCKDKIADYERSMATAKRIMICIGGPLNDNLLGFTGKQLKVFQEIMNEIDYDG